MSTAVKVVIAQRNIAGKITDSTIHVKTKINYF